MVSNAGAGIVVSDVNNPYGVAGIIRQFVGIILCQGLSVGNLLFRNRQIICNDLVDPGLNLFQFLPG